MMTRSAHCFHDCVYIYIYIYYIYYIYIIYIIELILYTHDFWQTLHLKNLTIISLITISPLRQ